MAEQNLAVLLRSMNPVLGATPYGYVVWPDGSLPPVALATVAEAEGLTVVADWAALMEAELKPGVISGPWARISMTIHSDLAAVGLTAALAGALGAEGISTNVIAGFHHDHIFVPWDRRLDAMAALLALSSA